MAPIAPPSRVEWVPLAPGASRAPEELVSEESSSIRELWFPLGDAERLPWRWMCIQGALACGFPPKTSPLRVKALMESNESASDVELASVDQESILRDPRDVAEGDE